ncbi:3'-5' exonuclease [Shewanella corallii]|uniref:3'-5' exonuclease n=1 Tax=Shewanella corallii TaxID=560080 RepID=A0ABT0NAV5_9GAMM|nr:exonuclease domain-containing protein [Shewanella corallii]MCL2915598.1 3'-5' exonuclease [Shewanella corallii]
MSSVPGLTALARWRLSRRLNHEAEHCAVPWLAAYLASLADLLSLPVSQMPLLAFDLEMTGLEPSVDEILSIGAVPIDGPRLTLTGAWHSLVAGDTGVGQSACIHGIVDQDLQQGTKLERALVELFARAKGRWLVAHHAPLDISFLTHAIEHLYGINVSLPAIDTMALEHRRLQMTQQPWVEGGLRLAACRQRYGLPLYPAHNALMDAIGCGELLLAQKSAMQPASVIELLQ